MSRTDYLISMINFYKNNDKEGFYNECVELIKHEEKSGNYKVAKRLNDVLYEKSKHKKSIAPQSSESFVVEPKFSKQEKHFDDKDSLFEVISPNFRLEDIILDYETNRDINNFISQWQNKNDLKLYNLLPQNKLLIFGPPGTGKTMTAHAIANNLNMPLIYLNFDSLMSSYLGKTSNNLGAIFNYLEKHNCLLLIDEIDAIAKKRSDENDLGELKRIVISLLQNLDKMYEGSIVIGCTNYIEIIDRAVIRRFDKVIEYNLPNFIERKNIIEKKIENHNLKKFIFIAEELAKLSEGSSANEIEKTLVNGIRNWVTNNAQSKEFKSFLLLEFIELLNEEKKNDDNKFEIAAYLKKVNEKYSYNYLSEILNIPKSTIYKKIKEKENNYE